MLLFTVNRSRSASRPILEPQQEDHRIRPHIKASLAQMGAQLLTSRSSNPPWLLRGFWTWLSALGICRNGTQTRRRPILGFLIRDCGQRNHLISLPISRLGGLHNDSLKLEVHWHLRLLYELRYPRKRQNTTFHWYAARLVRNNANWLLDGIKCRDGFVKGNSTLLQMMVWIYADIW